MLPGNTISSVFIVGEGGNAIIEARQKWTGENMKIKLTG
jgi:hypothetical protein